MIRGPIRIVLSLTALAMCGMAAAQSYPTKAIRALVGYGPGGITDVIARVVSDGMTRHIGQPVVVENRPGASGLVAANAAKNAAPDGYTVFIGPTTGFAPLFIKENAILASKELAPVSNLIYGSWFLYATSSIGVNSLKDLERYAKANPGKVRFASAATTNSLFMVLVAKKLGFAYDDIPYKTTDQTIAALLSGDAQVTFNGAAGFEAQIQAGKIKAIATLSPQRVEMMPNVATATEQGMPLSIRFSTGLWAPPGTSAPVIASLNTAAREALKEPELINRFKNVSLAPAPSSPEELAADLNAQLKVFAEAVEIAGFKPQ